MKKGASKKRHDSVSKQTVSIKPYGFCCDPKNDSGLNLKEKVLMPPFLSTGAANEGPDIKFRVHEEDVSSSAARSTQKSSQRGGQRNKLRSGGPNKQRNGNANGRNNKHRGDRKRGGTGGYDNVSRSDITERNDSEDRFFGNRMKCQRCRGPLKWYLEDEIAAGFDIMINKRIEKSNKNTEKNIKIAKKKEKKKWRKKKKEPVIEVKEDTNETEEKTEQKI